MTIGPKALEPNFVSWSQTRSLVLNTMSYNVRLVLNTMVGDTQKSLYRSREIERECANRIEYMLIVHDEANFDILGPNQHIIIVCVHCLLHKKGGDY